MGLEKIIPCMIQKHLSRHPLCFCSCLFLIIQKNSGWNMMLIRNRSIRTHCCCWGSVSIRFWSPPGQLAQMVSIIYHYITIKRCLCAGGGPKHLSNIYVLELWVDLNEIKHRCLPVLCATELRSSVNYILWHVKTPGSWFLLQKISLKQRSTCVLRKSRYVLVCIKS